tara:strand:+ start:8962 stop:9384 length:423 start_codon:yes stop_codon:yes gene_type:complete
MAQAVIRGTYADFKLVKTRNVVQMIIEIPIEEATKVTNNFGIPTPSEEKWVAVALLDNRKVEVNTRASKAIQQAGILGSDIAFGTWLKNKVPEVNPNETRTIVDGIRAITGVKSRSEFTNNDTALKIWERLYDEYKSKAV